MKRNALISLGLTMFLATSFLSCSNELNGPTSHNGANLTSPVISPDIVAWSGSETFTPGNTPSSSVATRGVDVNGNLWYQNWDRPTNVTEEEIAKITELMSTPRVGAKNDIHIDWNNYWVQQVYTGEATYKDGYGNDIGTGSSHMNKLLAYSSKKSQYSHYDQELGQNVYELVDKGEWDEKYEDINNFNSGSNNTVYTDDVTGEKFIGTTLMTDMYCPEEITDQFGYHNTTDSKYHYEYIIVEMDGSYYICFDFYATHPEGQDANKNMDVERDWIFNDWIVKISPAYHVGETPEDNSGVVTPPEEKKCEICGHREHDVENEGECPTCESEGGDCKKPTEEPDQPQTDEPEVNGTPIFCEWCGHAIVWDAVKQQYVHFAASTTHSDGGITCALCEEGDSEHICTVPERSVASVGGNAKYNNNEVEVNLSINEIHKLPDGTQKYEIADLVTKLSIHVRYPHDVEVIIPVPASIYCDQDDLYILQTHDPGMFTYGGEENTVVYEIKEKDSNVTHEVKLHVQFVAAQDDHLTTSKAGYIRVYTEGIDYSLISYLRRTNGDGINFEIYNYYNKGTKEPFGGHPAYTKEDLKDCLQHSFINFDWNNRHGSSKHMPDYYINAVNKTISGQAYDGDCRVWILGDELAQNQEDGDFYKSQDVSIEGDNTTQIIWGEGSERSFFGEPYQGAHFNGSDFNWIYQLKTEAE